MRTYTMVIGIVFLLLVSCVHVDVKEAEIDPEGERPPESELLSAPYLKPIHDCVYIPIDPDKAKRQVQDKGLTEQITSPSP